MSFLRPAVREALARWRDVALAALLAALALALWGPGALDARPIPALLLGLALALAAALGRDGWLRARLRAASDGRGPGLAAVREGLIGYLGTETGGLIDLDALASVEAERQGGGLVWILRPEGAAPLLVPADAEGAERLIDAFAALPGFDRAALGRALDAPEGVRTLLWRRARALASHRRAP